MVIANCLPLLALGGCVAHIDRHPRARNESCMLSGHVVSKLLTRSETLVNLGFSAAGATTWSFAARSGPPQRTLHQPGSFGYDGRVYNSRRAWARRGGGVVQRLTVQRKIGGTK